jgi:hypothetical protein
LFNRLLLTDTENSEEAQRNEENIIRSIPFSLWKKIETWGRDTGLLSIHSQSTASDIAYKIKNNRKLSGSDRSKAMAIFEIVCQHNIELMEEADELATKENAVAEATRQANNNSPSNEITLELIQKMVNWDRRRHILKDWQWKIMSEVAEGKKPLTDKMKNAFYFNLDKLKKQGFRE